MASDPLATQSPQQIDASLAVMDPSSYIPSALEKKRAVMMYLIFGVIVVLIKREGTPFEYFHLKQSTGWWMVFALWILISIVILFVPVLQYLPLAIIAADLVIYALFVKQARDGKFFISAKDAFMPVFTGVGSWFYQLFDYSFEGPVWSSVVTTTVIPTIVSPDSVPAKHQVIIQSYTSPEGTMMYGYYNEIQQWIPVTYEQMQTMIATGEAQTEEQYKTTQVHS